MSPAAPDHGLQAERTALAWRRTGLSLAVGALIAMRVLPHRLGPWALLPPAAALVLAVVLVVCGHVRHRRQRRVLDRTTERPLPDGVLPALTALLTAVTAAAALITFLLA